MNWKSIFLHGTLTGALAAAASIAYSYMYSFSLMTDFSVVVSMENIIAASLLGSIVASLGYNILTKVLKKEAPIGFNTVFTIVTLISLLGPFSTLLPLEVKSPELFVGLTIPMHLFPQLFWLSTKPLFHYRH